MASRIFAGSTFGADAITAACAVELPTTLQRLN
jgi:hypothetical protein